LSEFFSDLLKIDSGFREDFNNIEEVIGLNEAYAKELHKLNKYNE